jgi:membrane protease YdiL (CAAX protease family)
MSSTTFGPKRAIQILGAFLGMQILIAAVVGLYAGYRHVTGGSAAAAGGGIAIEARLTLGAAIAGTLIAGLVALRMARRTFGGAPTPIGWTAAPVGVTVTAALQGLALVAGLVVMGTVLPPPTHGLGPLATAALAGSWTRIAWGALAFAIAPPVEELVFRGALYTGLAERWRPELAGAVTTAIFVALHVPEVGLYWPAWIAIGALGALALRARVRTGSLVPAIALHATYNLGLVMGVFAASPK